MSDFEQSLRMITESNIALMISKQKDYGPKAVNNAPGGPLYGLLVRMHDKTCRIEHLMGQASAPAHESLRDSFQDLANYATIALMVMDDTWPKS